MADERREALREFEDRLAKATQEAQRLVDEAAASKPPPAGWQTPRQEQGSTRPAGAELDALINGIRALRDLIPPEAVARLAEALKDLLLALRALIDFYIERLERRPPEQPEVKDIPIQ